MGKRRRRKTKKAVERFLFSIYVAWMLWLLFGQRMMELGSPAAAGGYNLNLIPFKTLKMYFDMVQNTESAYLLRHAFINLAGNVVVFIPLGYFLPQLWSRLRSVIKTGLLSLALIVVVEIIQYITGLGSCDIDDLILNMIGVLIGYPAWKMIVKLRHK